MLTRWFKNHPFYSDCKDKILLHNLSKMLNTLTCSQNYWYINIYYWLILHSFFTLSSKSSVWFMLTEHLCSVQPHFKCPIALCGWTEKIEIICAMGLQIEKKENQWTERRKWQEVRHWRLDTICKETGGV